MDINTPSTGFNDIQCNSITAVQSVATNFICDGAVSDGIQFNPIVGGMTNKITTFYEQNIGPVDFDWNGGQILSFANLFVQRINDMVTISVTTSPPTPGFASKFKTSLPLDPVFRPASFASKSSLSLLNNSVLIRGGCAQVDASGYLFISPCNANGDPDNFAATGDCRIFAFSYSYPVV